MEPDWNIGFNYSFLGFVLIGWALAYLIWILARTFRFMIELFQSRTGQIRVEK
jgi:hypothetical protein